MTYPRSKGRKIKLTSRCSIGCRSGTYSVFLFAFHVFFFCSFRQFELNKYTHRCCCLILTPRTPSFSFFLSFSLSRLLALYTSLSKITLEKGDRGEKKGWSEFLLLQHFFLLCSKVQPGKKGPIIHSEKGLLQASTILSYHFVTLQVVSISLTFSSCMVFIFRDIK